MAAKFNWEDPFRLDGQLTDDERAVHERHVMVIAVVDSRRDFLAWLASRSGPQRAAGPS